MEPLLFRNGNEHLRGGGENTIKEVFQWSHFFLEMEIFGIPCEKMERAMKQRFNGATSFQKWKWYESIVWNDDENRMSFNGATSFQKWKSTVPTVISHTLSFCAVSMEPLLFRNGNASRGSKLRFPAIWFQWSHFFSEMEMPAGAVNYGFQLSGFNGATSFQKWKLIDLRWPLHCLHRGFNGATSFQKWKCGCRENT